MNIDEIKQELIEFKKILTIDELTVEEEAEVNEFIESLMKNLEKTTKKINIEVLSINLENYFKEK